MTINTPDQAARLRETLAHAEGADTRNWLGRPLLTLLAHGRPVTVHEIAAGTGRPVADVQSPCLATGTPVRLTGHAPAWCRRRTAGQSVLHRAPSCWRGSRTA